jgi:hypothetical protein
MFIKVKVKPESKEEKIVKTGKNSFEIWVKEKAIENKANQKVREILSDYFKSKNIRLIKGFKSRNKIFEIR